MSRRPWSSKPKIPTVSVIMSVYNGEAFLNEAIESILNQTYSDFEFIIVDDESTDHSVKIIKSYDDDRIRFIPQHNQGLVASLNRAIKLSRGKFIARMDQDDISLPTRLEKEVSWLSKDLRRGLVSTYFSLINHEDSRPLGINLVFPPTHTDLRRALYITNPFPHGACMFRKETIEDLKGYRDDYGPTEDYELWTRLAERWEIGLVPEILFWYRVNNPDSMSQKSNDEQNIYINKIRNEQWERPFVAKRVWRIWADMRALKYQVGPDYVSRVIPEYKSEQFAICKELLLRGRLKNAAIQFIGTFLITPVDSLRLIQYMPHALKLGMKVQLRRLVR